MVDTQYGVNGWFFFYSDTQFQRKGIISWENLWEESDNLGSSILSQKICIFIIYDNSVNQKLQACLGGNKLKPRKI